MIKRILCPVDFSTTSQIAFAYAERFAGFTAAELILLHAFDKPATLDIAGQDVPADATLSDQLHQLRPTSKDVSVGHVLHAGPAGDVICWLAQDRQCDLIIMGTHGRTGIAHALFGSTAEYVLRHARCPVLTIRDRADDEPLLQEPMVLPRPAPRFM